MLYDRHHHKNSFLLSFHAWWTSPNALFKTKTKFPQHLQFSQALCFPCSPICRGITTTNIMAALLLNNPIYHTKTKIDLASPRSISKRTIVCHGRRLWQSNAHFPNGCSQIIDFSHVNHLTKTRYDRAPIKNSFKMVFAALLLYFLPARQQFTQMLQCDSCSHTQTFFQSVFGTLDLLHLTMSCNFSAHSIILVVDKSRRFWYAFTW